MAHILLVEDQLTNRTLMRFALARRGHTLEEAADGATALRYLTSNPAPDLLITDLMMPVSDGWSLLERLKKDGTNLPVLIVSSVPLSPRELSELLDHGLVRFAPKPLEITSFIAGIDELLSQRRPR